MERKQNIYDRQYRNAGRQLCREIFGTDDLTELKEIAEKARRYDLILQTKRPGNTRGAGRKGRFSEEELKEICRLHGTGVSVRDIAAQFGTSRQTIYHYLTRMSDNDVDGITLRINYMEEYTVCSVIDIKEEEKTLRVENRVRDFSRCAFGALECPGWEALLGFLESRCEREQVQKLRDASGHSLSLSALFAILEKSKGRLPGDDFWLQIIHFEK